MSQYPNRADLRDATKRPQYGAQVRAERSAALVPPGPAPTDSQASQLVEYLGPEPGSRGALDRPSERPNEPVTAGASFGAGRGTDALAPFPVPPSPEQALLWRLQELLKREVNANLVALVEAVARRAGA